MEVDSEEMDLLFVVLLVVLVNAGCMFSFDRAQKAVRDLAATWIRALSYRRVSTSTGPSS